MATAEVIGEVVKAVRLQGVSHKQPFPHLIVRNALPTGFLKTVTERFSVKEVKRKSRHMHADHLTKEGKPTRFSLESKSGVDLVRDLFSNLHVKGAIMSRLNFNDDRMRTCKPIVAYTVDQCGYQITPHCDIMDDGKGKMLTCILYLPEEKDEGKPFGTEMYFPCAEERADVPSAHGCYAGIHKEYPKGFKFAKRAPYESNVMFCFHPVYGKTWHGVRTMKEPVTRKTIQIFYYP